MAWTLIKSMAWEVLGFRTLVLAVCAAALGGVALATVGVLLVQLALANSPIAPPLLWTIVMIAAAVYAGCGAYAGAQTVMLGAIRRAVGALRPALQPQVERVTGMLVARVPHGSDRVELTRVEGLIEGVFEDVARGVDLPVLRHIAGAAAAVGKWRLRRQLKPYLAPLRQRSEKHITRANLHNYLTAAACEALIDTATAPLVRARTLAWVLPFLLLLLPVGALVLRRLI